MCLPLLCLSHEKATTHLTPCKWCFVSFEYWHVLALQGSSLNRATPRPKNAFTLPICVSCPSRKYVRFYSSPTSLLCALSTSHIHTCVTRAYIHEYTHTHARIHTQSHTHTCTSIHIVTRKFFQSNVQITKHHLIGIQQLYPLRSFEKAYLCPVEIQTDLTFSLSYFHGRECVAMSRCSWFRALCLLLDKEGRARAAARCQRYGKTKRHLIGAQRRHSFCVFDNEKELDSGDLLSRDQVRSYAFLLFNKNTT